MLGERAGAPFAAWRINADYTVSGVTLYTCNDKNAHVKAQQAYTARGSWVWLNTGETEYFSEPVRALERAHERAIIDAHAAHEAYLKATTQARNARDALRKERGAQ